MAPITATRSKVPSAVWTLFPGATDSYEVKILDNGVIWSVAPESRIHAVVRLVVNKVKLERISFLPELAREVEPITIVGFELSQNPVADPEGVDITDWLLP